ncbi:MAG: glutaredoxin 3 [Alphaproteobacteria bacterium]|nr:glutaredoxin 3 [Alphaproteobacteria bacterium]
MPKIEIYTSPLCGYCSRAKKLLSGKGVEFTDINVLGDAEMRDKMAQRAGGDRKVPQIFVDGEHIGGSDELTALEESGRLDELLRVEA